MRGDIVYIVRETWGPSPDEIITEPFAFFDDAMRAFRRRIVENLDNADDHEAIMTQAVEAKFFQHYFGEGFIDIQTVEVQ